MLFYKTNGASNSFWQNAECISSKSQFARLYAQKGYLFDSSKCDWQKLFINDLFSSNLLKSYIRKYCSKSWLTRVRTSHFIFAFHFHREKHIQYNILGGMHLLSFKVYLHIKTGFSWYQLVFLCNLKDTISYLNTVAAKYELTIYGNKFIT